MAKYYYTVASLPQLYYDSENFPSIDGFLAVCEEHLTRRELQVIRDAAAAARGAGAASSGSQIVERWNRWNESLTADLAVLRAQAKGEETAGYQHYGRILGCEVDVLSHFTQCREV